jgi:hypothetical protein
MTIKDEGLLSVLDELAALRGPELIDDVAIAWQKVVRKFTPLIGATSVLLILGRSLEHNRTAFMWLPAGVLPAGPDAAVERMRASIAGRLPADILAAHRAILATFSDLMTTLIGARLTMQFLRAAFPVDGLESPNEENAK